jgi:D-amino-acid oxidase
MVSESAFARTSSFWCMVRSTMKSIAIVGAGVSGLTCGVLLAEAGESVTIFADETGQQTTSAAAGAIWYPYDAEPLERVIAWSLRTYDAFATLRRDASAGVSMVELRCFARAGEITMPPWGARCGVRRLKGAELLPAFASGFAMEVPLFDTTIYLDYLAARFRSAGGKIENVHFTTLDELPAEHGAIVNCAGIGARDLVRDADVEPHRGQVVIVPKGDLDYAIVCDDAPLMYVFPRTNDCVFGGTNQRSSDRRPSSADTASILEECARVLGTPAPPVIAERVGLRPYRRSGVRLERETLRDRRSVVHNYGHGGSGFTLSWGCATEVAALLPDSASARRL